MLDDHLFAHYWPEDARYIKRLHHNETRSTNKRPPGLIAPLLRHWHLLGPKNTKGRDLLFNEGIGLLNMADTSLDRFT